MPTIYTGLNYINYYTPEEARKGIPICFNAFSKICHQLSIDVPNIAIVDNPIQSIDPKTSAIELYWGYTYTIEDLPSLDKPLVMIVERDLKGNDLERDFIMCIIAHECRHLWQAINDPVLYKTKGHGSSAISSEAEIDADAFAIAYTTNGIDMDKIARRFCETEYIGHSDEYFKRINLAKKMVKQFEVNENTDKNLTQENILSNNIKKISILERIKRIILGKQ